MKQVRKQNYQPTAGLVITIDYDAPENDMHDGIHVFSHESHEGVAARGGPAAVLRETIEHIIEAHDWDAAQSAVEEGEFTEAPPEASVGTDG